MHLPHQWIPTAIAGAIIIFIILIAIIYILYHKKVKTRRKQQRVHTELPRHNYNLHATRQDSRPAMHLGRGQNPSGTIQRNEGMHEEGLRRAGNACSERIISRGPRPVISRGIHRPARRKRPFNSGGGVIQEERGSEPSKMTFVQGSDGYDGDTEPEVCTAREVKITPVRRGQVKVIDVLRPRREDTWERTGIQRSFW